MDATDQLRAAQRAQLAAGEVLRERELQIRGFFDQASVALALLDPEARLVRSNAAWRTLIGYTIEELRDLPLSALAALGSMERLEELLLRLRQGEQLSGEVELQLLDGSQRELWVELGLTGLWSDDQKLQGFTARLLDIRQRKETELLLQHSERRFQELMAQAPAGILEIQPDGECRYVNERWTELTGLREQASIGSGWMSAVHPDERSALSTSLSHVMQSQGALCRELRLLNAEGEVLWVSLNAGPILDKENRVFGYLTTLVDITERVRKSTELIEAKEEAERASEAKADFLAKMSHEIRTPMNSVLGMTDLALSTQLTNEQRSYLELVQSSGKSLLRLIDDILDFSRAEATHLELENIEFDLSELLTMALRPFAHRARQNGVELVLRQLEDTPRHVVGDPHRLRQVLVNLVSNAVKFTQEGEIIVEVGAGVDEPSGKLTLLLKVSDSGPGIAWDKQQAIFEAFAQEGAGIARRFGGTGLGLAICSQLVELMGGEIWVESEPARGSCFYVTIALQCGEEAALESLDKPLSSTRSNQILVVEVNAAAREVTRKMLERLGHSPVCVADPREALEFARALRREGGAFTAAVLDLPRWDGTAERFLNHLEKINGGLGVVRLSPGESDPGQSTDRHWVSLVKPVLPEELRGALLESTSPLSDGCRPSVPPAASLHAPARALRILVADDNMTNQQVIFTMLERLGHRAEMVQNGQEALSRLAEDEYDLVLMDVQMPVMDGLEAVRLLRQREEGTRRHVHVVALTAQAMQGDREHCLEQGMDDYLSKPINLSELERVIGCCSPQVDAVPSLMPLSLTPPEIRRSEGDIDLSLLMQRIGNNQSALQKISQLFERDSLRLVAELEQAARSAGPPCKSPHAHTLKGMLRNVCAFDAALIAESLEGLTRDGKWQEALLATQQLEQSVKAVASALGRAARTPPASRAPKLVVRTTAAQPPLEPLDLEPDPFSSAGQDS